MFSIVKSFTATENTKAVKLLYMIYRKRRFNFGNNTLIFSINDITNFLSVPEDECNTIFRALVGSPIYLAQATGNDREIKYEGIPWLQSYTWCNYSGEVEIQVNPQCLPFLDQLSALDDIEEDGYSRLRTTYQRWLYIFFTSIADEETTIRLSDFYDMVDVYEKEVYFNRPGGTYNFLRNILGITPTPEAKAEMLLSNREGRPMRFTPWAYFQGASAGGGLKIVNTHTGTKTEISIIKNGRNYSALTFRSTIKSKKTFADEYDNLFK